MKVNQHETRAFILDRSRHTLHDCTDITVTTQGDVKMRRHIAGIMFCQDESVSSTLTPDELEAVSDALRWAAGKMRQNASNANCGDCGKETE